MHTEEIILCIKLFVDFYTETSCFHPDKKIHSTALTQEKIIIFLAHEFPCVHHTAFKAFPKATN